MFLVLPDREQDFDTCPKEHYSVSAETADILIADAAEYLFLPVVEAMKAIYHPEAA